MIQGSVNKLLKVNFVQESKSTKFVLNREQEPNIMNTESLVT